MSNYQIWDTIRRHIKISYIYETASQTMAIMLSKPLKHQEFQTLPGHDPCDLIAEIDGVGFCRYEHRYKLLCGVNFQHFNTDKVIGEIEKILDDYWEDYNE